MSSDAGLLTNYVPAGDVITFVLCISLYVILLGSSFRRGKKFRIFLGCLANLAMGCGANLFFAEGALKGWSDLSLYILRDIYHFGLLNVLALYVCYLNELMKIDTIKARILYKGAIVLDVVTIILDCMSPFTGIGLHRDASGAWVDKSFPTFYIFAYAAMLVIMGYQLLRYSDRLFFKVRDTLLIMLFMAATIDVVGNLFASNTFNAFTFTPAMLVVLFMIHSNSYDINTGALGRDSFIDYAHRMGQKGGKSYYLNLLIYEGSENLKDPSNSRTFYKLWTDYFGNAQFFNISDDFYVLAMDTSEKELPQEPLHRLADRDFLLFAEKCHIRYRVIGFEKSGEFTITDFLREFDYLAGKMNMDSIMLCSDEQYAKLRIRRLILENLADIDAKCDMNDERILVYAQPVWNVRDNCFDTAEALMRMRLPDVGMVFPDEFIPLAEAYGYIHTLSLIIFSKTCRQIYEFLQSGYYLDRISVNFSAIELREENFLDEIGNIITESGIPEGKVAMELTESKTDEDYATVTRIIQRLKERNIHLYLDDFGTGYSNFDRIIRLKLNVVKFDRSLLLMADDREGEFLIKYFSEAFHEMGYEILYEGVENEKMEAFCVASHADYLQGYKYSKPVPIAELASFLSKK